MLMQMRGLKPMQMRGLKPMKMRGLKPWRRWRRLTLSPPGYQPTDFHWHFMKTVHATYYI